MRLNIRLFKLAWVVILFALFSRMGFALDFAETADVFDEGACVGVAWNDGGPGLLASDEHGLHGGQVQIAFSAAFPMAFVAVEIQDIYDIALVFHRFGIGQGKG